MGEQKPASEAKMDVEASKPEAKVAVEPELEARSVASPEPESLVRLEVSEQSASR